MTTKYHVIIAGCLFFIQAILITILSWTTSPNCTEIGHVSASIYFWNTSKFDVFHVNPPLVRIAAGAPIAFFCKPKYDWKSYSPLPQNRCEWSLGNAFFEANGQDDTRIYVFLMRCFCIPFVLAGGYFGLRLTTELYGENSGLFFLTLWTFSPLVIGWGATICPDVAAASVGLSGIYTFYRWLKKPCWKNAVIAGICLGIMPLVKMTWVIAPAIWGLLYILKLLGKKEQQKRTYWEQFVVILLIAPYTINMGYAFDGTFTQLKNYKFISGTFTGVKIGKNSSPQPGNRFNNSYLGKIPVPLPKEFVQGIDTQKLDFERGIESYIRGQWSDSGWWWYYVYVLLLREPLGVFGLTILAVIVTIFYRSKDFNSISFRDELVILLPMFILFTFICSQDGFSIHPRYIIPVLPFLYIFISKTARSLKHPAWAVLTLGFLFWVVISSLSFYPHSMSYFNELAGKPENWHKYLLGSNIDWGQNAYELKTWCEKHHYAKPLYISYGHSISLNKLGIERDGNVPEKPQNGWMLIGVNELYSRSGQYNWLQKYKPVDMIGYSIWIYKIEEIEEIIDSGTE